MIEVTWDELKSFVQNRKVSLQYLELSKHYKVLAFDGAFSIGLDVQKTVPRNPEQTDFEDNWKSLVTTNRPVVQQVALTLADDRLLSILDAFEFSAEANTTSQHTYRFNEAYLIRGFSFQSPDAVLGDYITAEIVDLDNVLGLGPGLVLSTPITKGYVNATTNAGPLKAEDISAAELPVAGLYLRITYTSTAAMSAVKGYVNLTLYKRQ